MKLRVTAEGVETPEQAAFLRQRGRNDLQGWRYSLAVEPTSSPACSIAGATPANGPGQWTRFMGTAGDASA